MVSSQKVIAACFCFMLMSPAFLVEAGQGMMGMFGGGGHGHHGGNEALEALLAVGLLAMLFRHHGHGFGLGRSSFGLGHSPRFGHGLSLGHGFNLGHGLGHGLSLGNGLNLGHSLGLSHGLGLGHGRSPFKKSPIAKASFLAPIFKKFIL